MPTMLARITCPNCHQQFQTPVEQILDVRADPGAKFRVLNGLVNFARCPHCGMQGALDIPFLYHDPDKELALIYMPMSAGRSDMERQKAIGQFTNAAMESLPPEERKAYLFQPQVFFTLESLVNKILDADGVTPEMIEAQKARSELLQKLLDAPSDEILTRLIEENEAQIDEDFFRTLDLNLELSQSTGQVAGLEKMLQVRERLLELTTVGHKIQARQEAIDRLRENPTRENLLNLLVDAPDEETRELLIIVGRPLLDYLFFQGLTDRIEQAEGEERERLLALREEILAVRERLDQEVAAVYDERAALINSLLMSQDPEKLARSRFAEMDEPFFEVLRTMLEQAQRDGRRDLSEALQGIWQLSLRLLEETFPPELQLFSRLARAENGQEIDRLLRDNRDLVGETLVQLLEAAEHDARNDGRMQLANTMALARQKAQEMMGK